MGLLVSKPSSGSHRRGLFIFVRKWRLLCKVSILYKAPRQRKNYMSGTASLETTGTALLSIRTVNTSKSPTIEGISDACSTCTRSDDSGLSSLHPNITHPAQLRERLGVRVLRIPTSDDPFSLNHSELVWPKKVHFGWRTLLKHHDGRFWLFKNFELLGLRVESSRHMSQREAIAWRHLATVHGSKICTCWGWRIEE